MPGCTQERLRCVLSSAHYIHLGHDAEHFHGPSVSSALFELSLAKKQGKNMMKLEPVHMHNLYIPIFKMHSDYWVTFRLSDTGQQIVSCYDMLFWLVRSCHISCLNWTGCITLSNLSSVIACNKLTAPNRESHQPSSAIGVHHKQRCSV